MLRPGRPKEELLAEMRKAVATIPGAQVTFGQPISHRIDHMISGSKTNLAVKIFGPDLAVLRGLAARARAAPRRRAGHRRRLQPGAGERAAARHRLRPPRPAALRPHARLPLPLRRGALPGHGGGRDPRGRHRLAGRRAPAGAAPRVAARSSAALPVPTPSGRTVRLGDVARPRFDLGPGLVRRENVERVAMITANVTRRQPHRDGRAGAAGARRPGSTLPAGYRIAYGGQFEEAARSLRNLGALSVLVLVGMYGLLFVAFRSHRHALIVLVNLPLALVGGVFAVALAGGVLSVASLVGFITLFGIATRNGVLLVSHYQHLMREEGCRSLEAVVQGSRERLAPVLMTALTAGLALIPLVLAGGEPGNEIQSPMAQVILGGLLTSTFLNLVLVPVLFARWGGAEPNL